MNKSNQNRVVYYDVVRVVASALVIFNHVPGYTLYQISGGGKTVDLYDLYYGYKSECPAILYDIGRAYVGSLNNSKGFFTKGY